MKRTQAFSLTEVLVVLVIIALLAAIIFPIFQNAKRKSMEAPCAANLRQIAVATTQYMQDNDDRLPSNFTELAASVPNIAAVLRCPSEKTTGANTSESKRMGKAVSYFYVFNNPEFRRVLLEADPNHGIAYCVLHGEASATLGEDFDALRDTTGLVLRLRRDGSIQHAKVGHMCGPATAMGQMQGRSYWGLVSDTKCVEPFCFGLTQPCP